MDLNFLENFEQGMDAQLGHYLSGTVASLCAIIAPIVAAAIVVYVILIGYAVMRGEAQDSLHSSMWKVVKWSLVAAFALSAGGFNTYVAGGLTGIEQALFQATTGANSGGQLLDQTLSAYFDLFTKLSQNISTGPVGMFPNVPVLLAILFLAASAIVFFGFAVCVFMLGKVAGVLVIALGPAFIVTLIFPPIQRFADAWLSAALNTVLIKVLAGMVLAISTLFLKKLTQQVTGNFDTTSILVNMLEILILSVAFGFILGYIPMLSASLVGGSPMPHITMPRLRLPQRNSGSAKESSGGSIQNNSGGGGAPSRNQPGPAPIQAYRRNVIANLPK